jgi:hypothetical protein
MFTKVTLGLASGALTVMASNAQQPPRMTASTGSYDDLYNSCHNSHAVFSCPGGGGQ